MDRITKVFFDPLATTKEQIRTLLKDQPVGSAHPFSPERLLLCRTATGVEEIDISSYSEKHFFNVVDLGELGQTLQSRMTKFAFRLQDFKYDYTVQQAPTSTFKVPIEADKIAILAVSERYPTYYDLCVADAACHTTCYDARASLTGMTDSGDITDGDLLLHCIEVNQQLQSGKDFVVFVSGFKATKLKFFQDRNPVVMIANHAEKAPYIVPVPLDAASIGDATICSPVVFKREGDSLIGSILPTPTTDVGKMCSGSSLQSSSFNRAVRRADWKISALTAPVSRPAALTIEANLNTPSQLEKKALMSHKHAIFITQMTNLASVITPHKTQFIRYGRGLEFLSDGENLLPQKIPSAVVLPCIFGSRLEGPLLLTTGKTPEKVPFDNEVSLRAYYDNLESAVIFVDERMTDNARNLATPWRINGVFIVQISPEGRPTGGEFESLLDLVNINAVTALAGPQSLVLVQISKNYYFYRGIANPYHLDTSKLRFGADVTGVIRNTPLRSLLEPRVKRIVNIYETSTVLLPYLDKMVRAQMLKDLFKSLSASKIKDMGDDIAAIVPQLQVLLGQKELVDLSRALIEILTEKVHNYTAPLRTAYVDFVTKEYNMTDPKSVKKKKSMLGELRKNSKSTQTSLESIISCLSNMLSSQTTSKRTYDLQRLKRQAAIQNNVEAVKSMTFETVAGILESKASEMGVLLLNIETTPYKQLLKNLANKKIDPAGPCCSLNSRVLFLEGFDAGIILEQSQASHNGPLKSQRGVSEPILALPYLSQENGTGSMLAWVCWDEFVNLETPFKVRWMEKCNEANIAALRIMMRSTLSQAIACREYNLEPGSQEVGRLMGHLLMAAMAKLAAMRTTAPTCTIIAEDTCTKLMRGLFGNLLTMAGSGVRPMSMVWQLFGFEPKFEVPATVLAWLWYVVVVKLYPFTGWPQEQFKLNLERLLDKAIIAVITKNEMPATVKNSRIDSLAKYCKLRNIQLEHSRTFVTIFVRMMNSDDDDRKTIASRLLEALPHSVGKQTNSFTRMIRYLKYVASTGGRREEDDIVIVSVYLKRSAVFKTLKQAVAQACRTENNTEIKNTCLALMKKFNEIAESWELPHAKLIMQNVKAYQGLLDTHYEEGDEIDDFSKTRREDFMQMAISDAEKSRVPWQVGKEGEFGEDIEPLDEALLHEIMTGEKAAVGELSKKSESGSHGTVKPVGMRQFSHLVNQEFIQDVEKVMTPVDVCKIMNVDMLAMRVFSSALNPAFKLEENLGKNFQDVVISLLKNRKDREKQQPTRKLFGMDIDVKVSEKGALLEIEVGKLGITE